MAISSQENQFLEIAVAAYFQMAASTKAASTPMTSLCFHLDRWLAGVAGAVGVASLARSTETPSAALGAASSRIDWSVPASCFSTMDGHRAKKGFLNVLRFSAENAGKSIKYRS